eukprot:365428-Chlamydomonas_euryale.AAC.13
MPPCRSRGKGHCITARHSAAVPSLHTLLALGTDTVPPGPQASAGQLAALAFVPFRPPRASFGLCESRVLG